MTPSLECFLSGKGASSLSPEHRPHCTCGGTIMWPRSPCPSVPPAHSVWLYSPATASLVSQVTPGRRTPPMNKAGCIPSPVLYAAIFIIVINSAANLRLWKAFLPLAATAKQLSINKLWHIEREETPEELPVGQIPLGCLSLQHLSPHFYWTSQNFYFALTHSVHKESIK